LIERLRSGLRAWLGLPSPEELAHHVAVQVSAQLAASASSSALGTDSPGAANDDPENPANWLSLEYVHDRVLDQLDAQNARWESADQRLRLILGLIGVVFAITSSFVSRAVASVSSPFGPSIEPLFLPFWVGTPLIAGVALYLLAGLIAVVAYWPLKFWRPPEPRLLRDQYLTTDPRLTELETVDTVLLYWEQNEQALNWKLRAFKFAVVMSTIATGLFGAAVIIQLVGITRAWS
jgi:hypothetical protein